MTRALPLNLDKNSDRYRICPNCTIPFMTSHRGSDFCCPSCHDEYNNKKKKEKALLKKGQDQPPKMLPLEIEPSKEKREVFLIINNQKVSIEEVQQAKEKNQNILNTLQIGYDGKKFSITFLNQRGFIFSLFDIRFEWPALKDKGKYCLVFGSYNLVHTDINEVLILKK